MVSLVPNVYYLIIAEKKEVADRKGIIKKVENNHKIQLSKLSFLIPTPGFIATLLVIPIECNSKSIFIYH